MKRAKRNQLLRRVRAMTASTMTLTVSDVLEEMLLDLTLEPEPLEYGCDFCTCAMKQDETQCSACGTRYGAKGEPA